MPRPTPNHAVTIWKWMPLPSHKPQGVDGMYTCRNVAWEKGVGTEATQNGVLTPNQGSCPMQKPPHVSTAPWRVCAAHLTQLTNSGSLLGARLQAGSGNLQWGAAPVRLCQVFEGEAAVVLKTIAFLHGAAAGTGGSGNEFTLFSSSASSS